MPIVYRDEPSVVNFLRKHWILLLFVFGGILFLFNYPRAVSLVHAKSNTTSAQPSLLDPGTTVSADGLFLAKWGHYQVPAKGTPDSKFTVPYIEVEYPEHISNKPLRRTLAFPASARIVDVAFSGRELALTTSGGQLWVYDLEFIDHQREDLQSTLLWSLPTNSGNNLTAAWSPDGRSVITGTTTGGWHEGNATLVEKWDGHTGQKRWEYKGENLPEVEGETPSNTPSVMVPQERGIYLAGTVSYPGNSYMWCDFVDYSTKKATRIWNQPPDGLEGKPTALAIGLDGKTIAIGIDNGNVVLVDRTGTKKPKSYDVLRGPVRHLALSPTLDALALSSGDDTIRYLILEGPPALSKEEHRTHGPIYGLGFSEDGLKLSAKVHGQPEEFDLR